MDGWMDGVDSHGVSGPIGGRVHARGTQSQCVEGAEGPPVWTTELKKNGLGFGDPEPFSFPSHCVEGAEGPQVWTRGSGTVVHRPTDVQSS
eukprot:309470-Chlamydomonas_euryale.AAC.1